LYHWQSGSFQTYMGVNLIKVSLPKYGQHAELSNVLNSKKHSLIHGDEPIL